MYIKKNQNSHRNGPSKQLQTLTVNTASDVLIQMLATPRLGCYELVKLGILFSAKAAMPTRQRRQKGNVEGQKGGYPTRTLLLIRGRKGHVEQPPLSPQSLRQTLLERYNPPTHPHIHRQTDRNEFSEKTKKKKKKSA